MNTITVQWSGTLAAAGTNGGDGIGIPTIPDWRTIIKRVTICTQIEDDVTSKPLLFSDKIDTVILRMPAGSFPSGQGGGLSPFNYFYITPDEATTEVNFNDFEILPTASILELWVNNYGAVAHNYVVSVAIDYELLPKYETFNE